MMFHLLPTDEGEEFDRMEKKCLPSSLKMEDGEMVYIKEEKQVSSRGKEGASFC